MSLGRVPAEGGASFEIQPGRDFLVLHCWSLALKQHYLQAIMDIA